MNKIFQISLISSVLATAGFAADVVVKENGTAEIENYDNGIDVNLEIQCGGSINVLDDATLNAGKTLTLQPGAEGTIESGKTFKNDGTIVMDYNNGSEPGVFSSGGGDVEQKYGKEEVQGKVFGDMGDCGGAKTWYIYSTNDPGTFYYNLEPGLTSGTEGENWFGIMACSYGVPYDYNLESVRAVEDENNKSALQSGSFGQSDNEKSIQANFDNEGLTTWYVYQTPLTWDVLYNKTSGLSGAQSSLKGWYENISKNPYTVFDGSPMSYIASSPQITGAFMEEVDKVLSNITINGVDALTYYAQDGAGLVDDGATDLSGGNLDGKNPKKIEQSQTKGFSPDVPAEIAPIKYSEDNGSSYKTLGGDMSGVSDLSDYFASFGVSFKKSDGSTDSTLTYNADGRSRFGAIVDGTGTDAVLIDNEEVVVDLDGAEIITNLHNIGVESPAPLFSGAKEMKLIGDNRLLTNATLDVPVKISGENAIPTNSKFKKALTIAESATIPADSEVQIGNALTVDSGKQLSVSGTIVFGTISE